MGIGDDAAVLNPSPNQQILIASDTLVEGIHFPDSASPRDIATRALCVNLSDMAAMGAAPKWFTLALTLPREKANAHWLADFGSGLGEIANQHHVALVGGDTTRGPLAITITVLGETPIGQSLTRAGAAVGDRIFVTGTLADGAAALKLITTNRSLISNSDRLLSRFYKPEPQIQTGLKLRGLASACIDISDGLLADLGHICRASAVAATVSAQSVPIADDVIALCSSHTAAQSAKQCLDWALFGGDDYQLCFTVSGENLPAVEHLIATGQINATQIGVIDPPRDTTNLVRVVDSHHNAINVDKQGFDHFG